MIASRKLDFMLSVSAIIVSDYEEGEKTWNDERTCIKALIHGSPEINLQIVVMESLPDAGKLPEIPEDIVAMAPQVQVNFDLSQRSSTLKDAGVKYCKHELIAVIEADCEPDPGWLELLLHAMTADPTLDIVSGRTIYGTGSSLLRVLTLLDRGSIERQNQGQYERFANNGALFRKTVLEKHPYPDEENPFISSELRLIEMKNHGIRFTIEPEAILRHAYGGLPFIVDVKRNQGFQAARRILRLDGIERCKNLRHRIRIAIRAVRNRCREDFLTIHRVGRKYLAWTDWPLLVVIFIAVRIPEFIGALSADQPQAFARSTAYR
jgi:hypothetical protein